MSPFSIKYNNINDTYTEYIKINDKREVDDKRNGSVLRFNQIIHPFLLLNLKYNDEYYIPLNIHIYLYIHRMSNTYNTIVSNIYYSYYDILKNFNFVSNNLYLTSF